jgi:ubiquinone/menaquinone biosynthesis C-methylase UbiE
LVDSYESVARFYDLFAGNDDLEFFIELAEVSAGPCLELGVGTGRVALKLVRRGQSIVGIDISEDMLRQARRKLSMESEDVRKRLSLLRADMRSFYLKDRFDLVYSPGGGFQECLTKDDMEDCLKRVRSHMKPEGKLALALWLPSLEREYEVWASESPRPLEDDRTVTRSIIWHRAEEGGRPAIDISYKVFIGDRLEGEYCVGSPVNILDPEDLRGTLRATGFLIEKEYGDFYMKEYSAGDEWMVIVARARL